MFNNSNAQEESQVNADKAGKMLLRSFVFLSVRLNLCGSIELFARAACRGSD